MRIDYKYSCEKQVAYQRIDNLLGELTKQYSDIISNPHKEWNSSKDEMKFSFSANGFNIRGSISLKKDGLILNGDLPWATKLFKGKIESTIKSKLEEMFK